MSTSVQKCICGQLWLQYLVPGLLEAYGTSVLAVLTEDGRSEVYIVETGKLGNVYSILELCSLGGTEVSSQKMWISASPPPTTTLKAAERPQPCAVPGVSPPGPCDVPPSGFLEPSSGSALGASTAIFFQQLIWHNLPAKITTRKPSETYREEFSKKPAADLNGMTPSWSLSFLSRFRSLRDFSEKSEEGPEGAVDGAASRSGSAESSCSISPLDWTG